jgi:hypothetical protein
MKHRGRRHLDKVRGGPLTPSGFERSAWTWEGSLDRAGAFVRGLSADSRDSQRRFRSFGVGMIAIVALMAVLALLAHLV